MEEAQPKFENYIELAKRLRKAEPLSVRAQVELSSAHLNYGVFLDKSESFEEAEVQFQVSIPLMSDLHHKYPLDKQYLGDLINALGWRADLYKTIGKIDDCAKDRKEQMRLLDESKFDLSRELGLKYHRVTAVVGFCYCLLEDERTGPVQQIAISEYKAVSELAEADENNKLWLGSLVHIQNVLLEVSEDSSELPFDLSELLANEAKLGNSHPVVVKMRERRLEKNIQLLQRIKK